MIPLFLTSGLFLGWSLGANDAANVIGSSVGSKMLRFKTAAAICAVFVILGAVVSGSGPVRTLGQLGSVNAVAGAFVIALSAALTVYWMTRLKIPVSTSQAIVGAIIGWNLFSGNPTDFSSLTKIVATWILCPALAAGVAALLYLGMRHAFLHVKIHLLRIDAYTRTGLIIVAALGSYSLGANNIANVMGVFVPVVNLPELSVMGLFTLGSAQQLFMLGGVAIAVGVFTYSRHVIKTVGGSLYKLSPEMALVVVMSHSIVLFLFASERLADWLSGVGLPQIPLVPVSSSQAVIGAIIGIALVKGVHGIRFRVIGEIAAGWVTTPIIAGLLCFFSLFVMENVFNQKTHEQNTAEVSAIENQESISIDSPSDEPASTP